jgi:hypothetical protein
MTGKQIITAWLANQHYVGVMAAPSFYVVSSAQLDALAGLIDAEHRLDAGRRYGWSAGPASNEPSADKGG